MDSQIDKQLDIKVRHANLPDASLLAQLGAQTFSETFAADNSEEDMAAYLATNFSVAQQTAELSDRAATFLIAEVEGVPVGYAKLTSGPPPESIAGINQTELVRLYVSKEWLGRGVGEALMRACLEEARNAGSQGIWLGVWERNARAQAFYRKWGFREVGEHAFQLGADVQRDILMARAI